jgi:hypothetical protein
LSFEAVNAQLTPLPHEVFEGRVVFVVGFVCCCCIVKNVVHQLLAIAIVGVLLVFRVVEKVRLLRQLYLVLVGDGTAELVLGDSDADVFAVVVAVEFTVSERLHGYCERFL